MKLFNSKQCIVMMCSINLRKKEEDFFKKITYKASCLCEDFLTDPSCSSSLWSVGVHGDNSMHLMHLLWFKEARKSTRRILKS